MNNAIGLYFHVPFCKHACPYCDFYKIEMRDEPRRARLEFPELLAKEVEVYAELHPEIIERPLATVYFGGGTPSTLIPEAVGKLIVRLREMFPEQGEPEITLEANPENLTEGRSDKWRAAGINRLSIGVQSFFEEDLKLLERLHSPQVIARAMENARRAGFANITLDLMFALPGQTIEKWEANVKQALELSPEHVSFYGLTYHETTPFEEWRKAGRLQEIDEDLQAEMYFLGAELVTAAGFEHYEISNFARPGFRSRHNQRYWSRADVLGFGPGAHSNVGDQRWANPEDLEGWADSVKKQQLPRSHVEEVSREIAAGEKLFTALRRKEGIGSDESPELVEACRSWHQKNFPEANKWMEISSEGARLTTGGWLLCDAIVEGVVMEFRG